MRLARAAAIGLLLMAGSALAQDSREDRFIIVVEPPPILGDMVQDLERHDPRSRLTHRKRVYRFEGEERIVVTHVSDVRCGAEAVPSEGAFEVMAIQVLSRVPRSFAEATRHDYYQEVYVRDDQRRLRLYENMTAPQMLELMQRFEPDCAAL